MIRLAINDETYAAAIAALSVCTERTAEPQLRQRMSDAMEDLKQALAHYVDDELNIRARTG